MSKRVAIIGASYLQEPLVKKAKALGYFVICFAWAEGAVCKTICDKFYDISILEKERILDVCREEKIDGILSIASDVAVPTINYIAQKMGLVGNDVSSGYLSSNKYAMREAFLKNNVAVPAFFLVDDITSQSPLSFPVIVKPTDRSGSRGVTLVKNEKEFKASVKNAIAESFEKKAIVEQFIEGKEVSVETISWKGKHYGLAITDKLTTGYPNFVELAHTQPSTLSNEIQDRIKQVTLEGLDALGLKYGAAHTECKIDSNENVFIIETGARMGGDFIGSNLVELSTGFDFLKGVLDVALGNFKFEAKDTIGIAGAYFLCKQTEGLLSYFTHSSDFEVVDLSWDKETLREVISSNERNGYMICTSFEPLSKILK